MTDNNLDLALRITADTKAAAADIKRLDAAVRRSGDEVARANAVHARSARTAAVAARDLDRAQKRATAGNTKAAASTLEAARARDKAARAALKLARADVSAATAAQRAVRAARQASGALDMQAAAATRAANANRRLSRSASSSRLAVQNVAFQVQDFAVQVAAGTAATRAFAQQAPQLLGGFGPLGAVLGAVVAVGLPLAALFFDLGEKAEVAGEASDRLADASERLRSLRDLAGDVEALADTYGAAADQARGLIAAQEALARREAERAVAAVTGGLGDVAGPRALDAEVDAANRSLYDLARRAREAVKIDPVEFAKPFGAARAAAIAELEQIFAPETVAPLARKLNQETDAVLERLVSLFALGADAFEAQFDRLTGAADLAGKFNITSQAARTLVEALQAVRRAEGPDAQSAALARLREALVATGAAARDQSTEQRAALDAFIARVLDAEDQVLKLAGAGEQIAPGLQSGVLMAERLADQLREAGRELDRFGTSAGERLEEVQLRIKYRDDPVERARQLSLLRSRREIEPVERDYTASGLTAGEARDRTAHLHEQAAATAEVEAETARLAERLRDMDKAARAGTSGAMREAARLRREMEKTRKEARALERALSDTLSDYAKDAIDTRDEIAEAWGSAFKGLEDALVQFVTTGKASFGDLVNSIVADIARIAIRQQITGPLAAALSQAVGGGSGGLSGGLFGNLFAGLFGGGTSGRIPVPTPRPIFHGGGVPKAAAHMPGIAYGGPGNPGRPGALGPGEVPAVLMEGEAVLTSAQSRAILGQASGGSDRARALEILAEAARYHTGGVAGVPGVPGLRGADIPALSLAHAPAPAASGPVPVEVNLTTQGTPQRIASAEARFDLGRMVVGLFLEDAATNGPMTQALRARLGGSREALYG